MAEIGSVVVTGTGGLLGPLVAAAFAKSGVQVRSFDRSQLDVGDAEAVHAAISDCSVVVHCASLTDVDRCESEPELAWRVNAAGAGFVAAAANAAGAKVISVSTDYVFDGLKSSPYLEADATKPSQEYGKSKLGGETAVRDNNPNHFIVRSAWIYGSGGKNFISRLPELASNGARLKAVRDQTGSPTYAPDLAQAIVKLAATNSYGTYHVTNAGSCTFAELCRYAVESAGLDASFEEVSWRVLGRPAIRPEYTVLANARWEAEGFPAMRPWREAVREFVSSP